MRSGGLIARDASALGSLQKLRFFPLAVTGGAGNRLRVEDGRSLLDLSASWGAASLGYSHPAIRRAVLAALDDQAGASVLSATSTPVVELAERLLALTPSPHADRRVWIGHSGSDANEAVARAVVAATGRPRMMAFNGAYHGGTVGSMQVSGHTAQAGIRKAAELVPYPDPRQPFEGDASGKALLAHVARLFEVDGFGSTVAAFFIEPIQSDGGVIVPSPGFFAGLAELCAQHGILTVCDEVKVGLGRTGLLHAFSHEGFTPDITVFGKGLGGGLALSAAIGPAFVMDHATAFAMQTLHGNAVSAAAGLAVLDTIVADGLTANAARSGAILKQAISEGAAEVAQIGDVRGTGLAIGVELISGQDRETAKSLAAATVYRAWELGAVFYYVGMNSNVLELTPPLTLTADEAREGAAILLQAVRDAVAGKVNPERLADFAGW
jgi:4-aminobutyrate aminotransferase